MEWYQMSDPAVVRELGNRIRQRRLNKNMTQQSLADKSGLSRITLSLFENGKSTNLSTFVQLLRGLEELDLLDVLLPDEGPSPLQMAKMEGKKRKRASRSKNTKPNEPSQW